MARVKTKLPAKPTRKAKLSDSLIVRLNNTDGPTLVREFHKLLKDLETISAAVETTKCVLQERSYDMDWAIARTLQAASFQPFVDIDVGIRALRYLLLGKDKEISNA